MTADTSSSLQVSAAAKDSEYSDPSWGAEQLARISILSTLNTDELKILYGLGSIKLVSAQAHVVIEGETSRGLYILVDGTVSVYKSDPANNNMIRLAFLEKGATFGELSLFDSAPRSATIVAESSCRLFCLEALIFNEFLEKQGDPTKIRFYKKCAEDMAERFRKQNGDYIAAQKLLWQHALRRDDLGSDEAAPKV